MLALEHSRNPQRFGWDAAWLTFSPKRLAGTAQYGVNVMKRFSARNLSVWLLVVLGLAWVGAGLTACNTIEGAGEDIDMTVGHRIERPGEQRRLDHAQPFLGSKSPHPLIRKGCGGQGGPSLRCARQRGQRAPEGNLAAPPHINAT